MKEGVDRGVAYSTYYIYHKTATCTHDIISNAPAINAINRRSVFSVYFITSLTSQYLSMYNLHKYILMFFECILL